MPRFGSVAAPRWSDRPVLIVGTGESLRGFDLHRLNGLGYVLAVKEAWKHLPFADACFGLDMPWLVRARADLVALAKRIPLYVAIPDTATQQAADVPGAVFLRRVRKSDKFSEDPERIESGGHSGFGAVNVAYLKRAKLIYLFGFDYRGGHFCSDDYKHKAPGHNDRYLRGWATAFNATVQQLLKAQVKVINASPQSALLTFPRVTLEQAIFDLRRLHAERDGRICGGAGECAGEPVVADSNLRSCA